MLIVCLAGVGASVAAGSAEALTLVSITLCVQLLVFLWVACLFPSSDRVDNFAVALGWGGESSSMLLLVLASFFPSLQTGTLESASYALSLLGVGAPLLRLSYDALLAPLGSWFFQYIDGEARTNPCSIGALLQLGRLLLTVGHKFAATCCAGVGAGSSGGATTGMDSGRIADRTVVYGGRDGEHPRRKISRGTRPEDGPRETPSCRGSSRWLRPSSRLPAPDTAQGSDREAGLGAARARISGSAQGTPRLLTERSQRGPTGLEPQSSELTRVSVRV